MHYLMQSIKDSGTDAGEGAGEGAVCCVQCVVSFLFTCVLSRRSQKIEFVGL